jgi:hypothetical protein
MNSGINCSKCIHDSWLDTRNSPVWIRYERIERISIKLKLTFSRHYAAGWSHSVAFSLFPDFTNWAEATNAAFQEHLTSIFSTLCWLTPYDAAVVTTYELDSCVNFQSHVVLKPKFRASINFSLIFWFVKFQLFTTRDQEKSCPVQHFSLLTKQFIFLFSKSTCFGSKPLFGRFYKKGKHYNLKRWLRCENLQSCFRLYNTNYTALRSVIFHTSALFRLRIQMTV